MRTRDHFKNVAGLKSHMSRVNFRIAKTVSIWSKIAMIAITALFIANITNAQVGAIRQQVNQQSIKPVYPTKDRVISDFVVTDPRFGAKAKPGFDNRSAFQAAIDVAYNNGGGIVYIPAGNYEFRSTQTATKSVRVRQGADQTMKDFKHEYVLNLPTSVQLRGDWADPESNKGKVLGTILEVRVGKNAPNYNGTVESWWNDSQAGNALRTTYTNIADRFIDMNSGTGVTNLSIWYPEQDINDIKPYPWTLFQPGGDCVTIENVTLVNAYNGFYSAPSELHYVLNSYMTALSTGIEVHVCTDIGRIENVKIDPKYWANSGLPGSPSLAKVAGYTKANGTGFNMHRSDWEYVSNLYVSDYKTGMWVGRESGFSDTPNAQFYETHIKNCRTGLYIQAVNPYGLLISNSTFGAEKDGKAVYFYNDFKTSVQFNGVDFTGPIVSDGSDGVISFESCTFSDYSNYALKINNGNVLLTQSEFKKPAGHVFLGSDVNTLKSVNSGYNGKLEIKNDSRSAKVEINNSKEYLFDPIPKNVVTDIKVHPRPASNKVLKVDLPRATGFNNDQPTEDVSAQLQKALNEVKAAGGGTVYLPGGRYLVNNPIKVPSGVELRGTWDVQHHTQSGGVGVFTTYAGGAAGEKGASLIQLEASAGIRGLTIVQLNIATDGFSAENPRVTPFLIQGQGPNVYIVNVTVGGGDKGIDLASYNTSKHYVDYFAGVFARAGIWVGGGAEGGFIRNMQLNPHYGSRIPQGGQGYPRISLTRFVQSNCSALKFADIKNQTIFNNFVFGSFYGIHFLKDAITSKDPGEMTVIGHGSDGCSYSLFVEDADKNTKLIAINSELVNTRTAEPVRSYVLMGGEANTDKVHPDAQLILYNSAFWGSPTVGAIINSGTVRFQQANFQRSGAPGIDNRGGKAHVYSSYFAQRMPGDATGDNVHAKLHATGASTELTNNYYISGFRENNAKPGKIYGSDIVPDKKRNSQ
ncbi:MAG TPA: glycosyl hydrolase family 28-related protein [Pedobacter sp.]|uniref:glycosyl hydrolase family 28-related protein n=1 Tax=Pedobacter sp. TaxID=1411316 RepID=UPI002B5F6704|nr:glycosyl hydrolase family 28-related protein [Pedobacter sp.]HMI03406.1 glycosyl hydrolase family 28-related protein [Pedobacter sp.]